MAAAVVAGTLVSISQRQHYTIYWLKDLAEIHLMFPSGGYGGGSNNPGGYGRPGRF